MATAKKRPAGKRWVCPDCGGGVLAPSQPRLDDVRRYCLPCSKKTGRLVRRTCPALDRDRAEKQERAAAKRTTKASRERDAALAARSHKGIDLIAEAKRMWNLPAFREHHGGRRPVPTIDLRRRDGYRSTGRAWTRRIVMTLGRDDSTVSVLELLIHELAHAAVGWGHGHDAVWASALADAARQHWGAEHFTGVRAHSGYAVDSYITAGIRRAREATSGS